MRMRFDVYDEPISQHGSKSHGSGALSTSTKDTQTVTGILIIDNHLAIVFFTGLESGGI